MTLTSDAPEAVLTSGLVALSFADIPRMVEKLMAFGELLLGANRRTNLIGDVDIHKLVVNHFLDSLAPFALHRFRPPILDLGSGAGLPGIPVAIAFPRAPVTLMEPRRLRADFLQSTVSSLGLGNVEVVRFEAKAAGRSVSRRERAGTVLMRAVGKPPAALELGLPLLKRNGALWLYRGRASQPDDATLAVAQLLGGTLASAKAVDVPHLGAERHLWVFRKVRPTPASRAHRGLIACTSSGGSMIHVEHSLRDLDDLLLSALGSAGLYAVGGRVRDETLRLHGFHASDAHPTSPTPDYLVTGLQLDDLVHELKRHGSAELVGASFGVIKFAWGGLTADIALPRRERSTGVHHRDFQVDYDPSIPIEDDLARRDFRINMMAQDLRTGEIIDPYGGQSDIEARRLDVLADKVFVEDPLRILRGAQFAARFDLTLSPRTAAAMRDAARLISTIAPERVADELTKLLTLAKRPSVGLEILRESGALEVLLPELMEGWGIEQNEYHRYTVYFHNVKTCDAIAPKMRLRLAALFHDVGKPRTKDGPHFYRHEIVGEAMTKEALERFRFPFEIVRDVAHLVRHHMYAADDQLTDAAVRRFVRRVGVGAIESLFALRAADVAASGLAPRDPAQSNRFESRVSEAIAARAPFGIADLAVDGGDIIAIMRELKLVSDDFAGDRRVGEALNNCLEQVLDDPTLNERESLRTLVRAFFAMPSNPSISRS